MLLFGRKRRLRPLIVAAALVVLTTVAMPATALAHAELRQSSPAAGETVGGAIHAVTLQFFDLDLNKPQDARIFDAAGNELDGQLNQEDQRLVIALIDPITTPGEYLVTFAVNGLDGDFSEDLFRFEWQEGAPEPSGIDADLTVPVGFDTVNYVLILVGAAVAAFIAHRFWMATREHKAAQAASAAQAADAT